MAKLELYNEDRELTISHQQKLDQNHNLSFWFSQLAQVLKNKCNYSCDLKILEIGSGSSPLKKHIPELITSDILELNHIDLVFDCQDIDKVDSIEDHSIDVILLTNTLHHIARPLKFLEKAHKKLISNGSVILVEPYFSFVSSPIYRYVHHEVVNFTIDGPLIDTPNGPLTSSNQAIPHMIFFKRIEWLQQLEPYYYTKDIDVSFFSSLSYFLSGGFSTTLPIPQRFYRKYLTLENKLVSLYPRILGSFFIASLKSK